MGQSRSIAVAHRAQALFQAGRLGDLSDAELIQRSLAAEREPIVAEMAFSVLMERHGPMVYRVCKATLGDFHDAEDAFQATFLILVRESPRLRVHGFPGTMALPGGRAGVSVRTNHGGRRRTPPRAACGHRGDRGVGGRDRCTLDDARAQRRTHASCTPRSLGCPTDSSRA